MGQARLRKQLLQTISSAPIPDGGLFFSVRRNFISVALAVRHGDGDKVNAALFCSDDLRDGLFQCLGRTYDSTDGFQDDFRAHGADFRLARLEDCQRRIALGLRIRHQACAPAPKEFSHWSFLLGPLDSVRLPEALYLCPVCESALPPGICRKILSCVDSQTGCYMVCQECIRLKHSCPSAEAVAVSYGRTRMMFESMGSFSLKFEEDKSYFSMVLPGQEHRDAIPLFLEDSNDPALAAAFALETWMNRATGPNEMFTDHHVEQALEEMLQSRLSRSSLPGESVREVRYVREAAEEGLAAFEDACADRWDAPGMEAYMTAGIEKVLESVKRHRNSFNRRSYIAFIARHLK